MQKITPHLWFDHQAKEAAGFYTSVFPDSRITKTMVLRDTPSGDCDLVNFTIWGQEFMSISAGPLFKFNPSVSFIVNFDPLLFKSSSAPEAEARKTLDDVWERLSDGGTVLMPLDEYPFSKRFGWIQDKYGVTWQLILSDPMEEPRPAIIPAIMFIGKNAGRAEEAINYYTTIFKNAKVGAIFRYGEGQDPEDPEAIMFADFMLEKQWFAANDSAQDHDFEFNEAISLVVHCDTQKDIDYYWEKLSAVPEAEQCGWLKDKFGLSWQIVPSAMDRMMDDKDEKRMARVTEAFLQMKKFDVKKLELAYQGA